EGGNSDTKNLVTVRLHLYLSSLAYELIRESPAYTIDTLISNLGGNLGLFLGFSIISMIELIEFFFDLSIGLCCRRKKYEKKPTSTTPIDEKNPQSGIKDTNISPPVTGVHQKSSVKSTNSSRFLPDNDSDSTNQSQKTEAQQYFNYLFEDT
ncbi:unnamed protein product, partial [Meganyctiphanes norvegica]